MNEGNAELRGEAREREGERERESTRARGPAERKNRDCRLLNYFVSNFCKRGTSQRRPARPLALLILV